MGLIRWLLRPVLGPIEWLGAPVDAVAKTAAKPLKRAVNAARRGAELSCALGHDDEVDLEDGPYVAVRCKRCGAYRKGCS